MQLTAVTRLACIFLGLLSVPAWAQSVEPDNTVPMTASQAQEFRHLSLGAASAAALLVAPACKDAEAISEADKSLLYQLEPIGQALKDCPWLIVPGKIVASGIVDPAKSCRLTQEDPATASWAAALEQLSQSIRVNFQSRLSAGPSACPSLMQDIFQMVQISSVSAEQIKAQASLAKGLNASAATKKRP